MHRDLIVLAGKGSIGARATATTAGKTLEEIGEIEIVERALPAKLLLPIRRGTKILPGLEAAAELVVRRALFLILERLVCLGDLLEFLFRTRFLAHVRMMLLRKLPIR